MAGLATENIKRAGFDLSMKHNIESPCADIWDSNRCNYKPKSHSITETTYHSANLIGQGTTIWHAHLAGSSDSDFIIQDIWQDPSLVLGKEDEATLLKHIKSKDISSSVLELVYYEQVQCATSRKDVDSVLQKCGVKFSDNVGSNYKLLDHIHTCLLFKSPGTIKPLGMFSSCMELLNAFHDTVLGMHYLLIFGRQYCVVFPAYQPAP
jgi:hypothetical protein